ncbi:MAG: efflux RND transporter periplasmic adaptor subunit [Phycisphaerales bacterium]|nr:efflux RND transporter periplasmic adaptor subunit [Phycisphaerales bacterium]
MFADDEVLISAKVAGRVDKIHHDLGDRVEPDQLLAELDPTDYQLEVAERELTVQATLAKLGLSEMPDASFDPQDVPTVRRSSLQLANAFARYERLRKLYEQVPPLISEQEYQDSQTAYQVASSAHEVEIMEAKALIAEARTRQAEYHSARQRLRDTKINSPTGNPPDNTSRFAVAARMVSPGEFVAIATPMFRLIDDNPIKMQAMVPERHMGQITDDLPAIVNVQAYPEPFTGRVSRVSPSIDSANRTFPVEVQIANDDGRLKAGAFAQARIELPTKRSAVQVPSDAVTSFAGVKQGFVVRDGKAVELRVQLGERSEDASMVQVVEGLSTGERIILSPPANLVSDTPVQVTNPESKSQAKGK